MRSNLCIIGVKIPFEPGINLKQRIGKEKWNSLQLEKFSETERNI